MREREAVMNRTNRPLRRPVLAGLLIVGLTFFLWTSFSRGQTEEEKKDKCEGCGPLEPQAHEHPLIMSVMGVDLQIPYPECVPLVNRALRENHPVPVDNEECREVMIEALEIQRTAPPIAITGPPAQRIPTSEGAPHLGDSIPKQESPAPEPATPGPGAPSSDRKLPFAEKSAD
jgi:hypothetical protein